MAISVVAGSNDGTVGAQAESVSGARRDGNEVPPLTYGALAILVVAAFSGGAVAHGGPCRSSAVQRSGDGQLPPTRSPALCAGPAPPSPKPQPSKQKPNLTPQVLERNWRCDQGELDIVARDGDTLVFYEVKTRLSDRFGSPVEAVTRAKAARLRRLALCWVREHDILARSLRIDVIR